MKSSWAILLILIILFQMQCFASQLRQQGATVNYCNTKYVSDCHGITKRLRRGEPYRTNLTATTKHTWGNNVTISVVMFGGITFEVVKIKLCDASKIDWLFDYIKTYGHVDGKCPYAAGPYGLFNMEFPPKNLPEAMTKVMDGNFKCKFYFLVSKTDEIIIEATIIFQRI